MTERERLIELLNTVIFPREGADPAEVVADFLLANGVRLPVTCGECKYRFPYHRDYVCSDEIYCSRYPYKECYVLVEKDDFCNYGERRADNGT